MLGINLLKYLPCYKNYTVFKNQVAGYGCCERVTLNDVYIMLNETLDCGNVYIMSETLQTRVEVAFSSGCGVT